MLTLPVLLQYSKQLWLLNLVRVVWLHTAKSTSNNIFTPCPTIWPPRFRAVVVGTNFKQNTEDDTTTIWYPLVTSSVQSTLSLIWLFGQLLCEMNILSKDIPYLMPVSPYVKYLFPLSDNLSMCSFRVTAPAMLICL